MKDAKLKKNELLRNEKFKERKKLERMKEAELHFYIEPGSKWGWKCCVGKWKNKWINVEDIYYGDKIKIVYFVLLSIIDLQKESQSMLQAWNYIHKPTLMKPCILK